MTIGYISWNTSNQGYFCVICCQEDTPEDGLSIALSGLQTKKSSKEPLAPIREKLRRQIIFLGAAE